MGLQQMRTCQEGCMVDIRLQWQARVLVNIYQLTPLSYIQKLGMALMCHLQNSTSQSHLTATTLLMVIGTTLYRSSKFIGIQRTPCGRMTCMSDSIMRLKLSHGQ